MRDLARQLHTDFSLVPQLVDEYVVHTPRPEAIKASRQVCGVTHYLSRMAGVDPDMDKCAMYGVTITCIDEVTDLLDEELHPEAISQALAGDPPWESLRAVPHCASMAEDDRFGRAITEIARAQDWSLDQFGDIGPVESVHITRKKGGWSARANLALLKPDLADDEWDFARSFGFLMQMLDDHLDKPKDEAAGVSTPFTFASWDEESLRELIDRIEEGAHRVWDNHSAISRFFTICRVHRYLGRVENETPFRASWFAPGYL